MAFGSGVVVGALGGLSIAFLFLAFYFSLLRCWCPTSARFARKLVDETAPSSGTSLLTPALWFVFATDS